MSFIEWEVTADDVALVLNDHGVSPTQDLVDWVFDELPRVTAVAACAAKDDISAQVQAALSEIENILIENKVLCAPKRFREP